MNATNSHLPALTPDNAESGLHGGGLKVGQTGLPFKAVALGEERFRILKITPPRPDVAVTLIIDSPTHFQVAVGVEHLHFVDSLTFVPQPGGTYVHLRYKPQRQGRHLTRLRIQTVDEEQTVDLSGRTTGLAALLPPQRTQPFQVPAWLFRLTNTVLIVVAVGLIGYYGYVERCQLFPTLCTSEPALAPDVLIPARKASPVVATKPSSPGAKTKKTRIPQPALAAGAGNRQQESDQTEPSPAVAPKPRTPVARRVSAAPEMGRPPGRTKAGRAAKKTDDVSDLERVLNQDTTH